MRGFRTVVVLMGVTGGVAAASAAFVSGCGGDDSTASVEDAATDATTDGTTDAPNVVPDGSGQQPETGGDTGSSMEAGEAGDGGGGDAGDGSSVPEGSVVTAQLLAFPGTVATAYCQRLETCCGADAGNFNMAGCVSDNVQGGWELSLPFPLDVLDAGHVALDPTASADCIAKIGNFACPTSDAGAYGAITTACFKALQGTIPIGQGPCTSPFECASGSYCTTVDAGDSGPGTACEPLLTVGQPCGNTLHDTACSDHGSGANPANFCDRLGIREAGVTCQPEIANGSLCTTDFVHYDDESCQSLLCGDDWNCGTTLTQPSTFQCGAYQVTPDGG
jgi:hypothetical protein